MTPIQVRTPIILSNIQELDREYRILIGRKKHLQEEMKDSSPVPQPVRALRRTELAYINTYAKKMENFLSRYGFIDKKGSDDGH